MKLGRYLLLSVLIAINYSQLHSLEIDFDKQLGYMLQLTGGKLNKMILHEWLLSIHPYWNWDLDKDILIGLENIDLEFYHINYIDPRTFDGLSSLKFLSLGNNMIKRIDSRLFQDTSNLERLVLHNNQITRLDGNILNGKKNLWFIDLENNNIRSISNQFFKKFNQMCITDFYFFNNKCFIETFRVVKVMQDFFTGRNVFKLCVRIRSSNCKRIKEFDNLKIH